MTTAKLCRVCGDRVPDLPYNPGAGKHCPQTCRDIDEHQERIAA